MLKRMNESKKINYAKNNFVQKSHNNKENPFILIDMINF